MCINIILKLIKIIKMKSLNGKALLVLTLGSFIGLSVGANFNTLEGYYGQTYSLIPSARSILVDDVGDILVFSSSLESIIALTETSNSNGTVTVDQVLILNGSALSLNYGMTYSEGYLYASSTSTVFRWPYIPGQRQLINATGEIVVSNIPAGMRHGLRSLIFDHQRRLYVHVGSADDVDMNSDRAKIRRFNLTVIPPGGIDFELVGEVFVDGVRNNVGLAVDSNGVVWGTDNGPGPVERPDLGGDITDGNPADELNRFITPGAHYGFPYCFSSFNLSGYETGSQFAWSTFLANGTHDDNWCGNSSNNVKPQLALEDHSAALGITFFDGSECENVTLGAFPCSLNQSAFIAFHGSNPDYKVTPSGYAVSLIHFDKVSTLPTGDVEKLIFEPNPLGCRDTPGGCFRPVGVVFDKQGHLIVTTDTSGEIFRVFYQNPPPAILTGNVI